MPDIEKAEFESIIEDLRDGVTYGYLPKAISALGLLTRYIEGLIEEQKRWKITEALIIKERREYNKEKRNE